MENIAEMRIWRYMDLARFISLLVTESLYFACPLSFHDPYEGLLPKSHIDANAVALAPMVKDIISLKNQLAYQFADSIDLRHLDAKINSLTPLGASREASREYVVCCWHISEYESEAMWKIYSPSGQGIAIESTVEQLRLSLDNIKGLIIDSVRYMDFDKAAIEKGHKHYVLFLKRKSFEYERELRAILHLPKRKEVEGDYIKCNLNTLITNIHISPFAPAYFRNVVETLCLGKLRSLDKPVIPSQRYIKSNYGIKT